MISDGDVLELLLHVDRKLADSLGEQALADEFGITDEATVEQRSEAKDTAVERPSTYVETATDDSSYGAVSDDGHGAS